MHRKAQVSLVKIFKILLITIFIVALAVPILGCGTESDEAEPPETQIVTVQRGDLTIDITAAGNLALSHTEDLAFDLFYQEGTVEEVLVEEGDIVTEGHILASLDTEEWQDNLEELQDKLTAAERALTAKEHALVQAEREVIDAERTVSDKEDAVATAEHLVTTKELAVSQAQLNLETAEYNLSQIEEVKEAQDAVDDAEDNLRLVKLMLMGDLGGGLTIDFAYWSQLKTLAEEDLVKVQEELQDILDENDISLSNDVVLDVAAKQLLVKQKQLALEDAQLAVADAEKAVDDAEYDLEDAKLDVEDAIHDVEDANLDVKDARKALVDAQEELEEANSKSPIIVALFDGFITKVNVEGGDEVLSGTVAVQLADPSKFEAAILVSEMDILQVKEGGEASVQVDAMPGLTLPAKVTHISPTATIQSGVVNYEIKVEVESLEAVMQERQEMRQQAMQGVSSGEIPERLQQAIEAGQITQEEAEEMMKQRQQGLQSGQAPTMMPEDFQLREGLTVTVSILVDEKTDVLLVPNSAITRREAQSYVQVVPADGAPEERAIQTGISDWQYTEVTSGLSEGEQIVVPQGTTATTTQQGPQGGIMIPGIGRPH